MMFHFFNIYKIIRVLLILSFVLVAHTLKAQTVRSDVYLLDQPEGQTTKNLVKANSAIKVLQRKSFWVEIQSENKTGWLKLNAIQFMTATNVVAIDKVISENGKFRVLASQAHEIWPSALQVGGGVKALGILQNVPLAYEIWRKVNGFPPEFYSHVNTNKTKEKNEKK